MAQYDGVPWAQWLVQHYPEYFISADGQVHFSTFHQEFWEWVFSIDETRPQPFTGIVFRFGGKSTNVEAAVTYLGAESLRKYCLYVSGTQTQADDHVSSIGEMLRSPAMLNAYPLLGQKMTNQFNQSMGWRVNRLRTAHGFTVDAVGLDKAMRGAKLGNQRPDIIAFDDIDATHDSARTVEKKIETLTRSIFPAGATNVVILGVQNLVQHNGIFAKLSRNEVDFMADKKMSGPWPALDGATWETDTEGLTTLTGGTPTWSGMDLDQCQNVIDDIGLKAWRVECQQTKPLEFSCPTFGITRNTSANRSRFPIRGDLIAVTTGVFLNRGLRFSGQKLMALRGFTYTAGMMLSFRKGRFLRSQNVMAAMVGPMKATAKNLKIRPL